MQKSFYQKYYSKLMHICVRYAPAREDAEQWVHDGFIKIFSCLHLFRYQGSFDGWMKKIMVRMCIDQLRTQNTQKFGVENNTVYNDHDIADDQHYVNNDFLLKTDADALLQIINTLPDKQRAVFNLIVFEDYSHKEIATALDITENHSYHLLHQARKQLKNALQQQSEKKELKYEQK